MAELPIVLGVTGASGTAYAVRLAQVLLLAERRVELVVSDAARQVSDRELGISWPALSANCDQWRRFLESAFSHSPACDWGFADRQIPESADLRVHSLQNYSAGIASGSFRTAGMVICPCSMGTLSSIACGASSNLIQRAADVHLKERRPLLLVPRETPLGLIALENMTRLTQAGATILPSMPGFYQNPSQIADLVDFIVARICDHLGVNHHLVGRWGEEPDEQREPEF
ncbi:MAG: flavin prenyltransferase UbiX [Planctomycetaceae bacterium]